MNKTSKTHNRHNKVLHNNTLRNKNKQKRKRTNNKRNITSNNKRTRRYGGGLITLFKREKPNKESNIDFIKKYQPKIPSKEKNPSSYDQLTELREFINKRICSDGCDNFHDPFIKYLITQANMAIDNKKNITFLNSGNNDDNYSIFKVPTMVENIGNIISTKQNQKHRLPSNASLGKTSTNLSLVTTTDKEHNTTLTEPLSLHQIFLMEKREETDGKKKHSNRVISTENNISNHVDSFFFVYLVEAKKDAYASYLALDHLIFKQTAEKIKLENDMICLQFKYDIYYSQLVYYSEAINNVYNKIKEVFNLEPQPLTVQYVDKANKNIIDQLNDYIKTLVTLYKPDGGREYLDVLKDPGKGEDSNWAKYQNKYRIGAEHTRKKYDNIFEDIFDLNISPLPDLRGEYHWSQLNRDEPWKQRVPDGNVDTDDPFKLDTVTLFGVFETLLEIHKKIDELVPEIYEEKLRSNQPTTEANTERIKPPTKIYYNNPKTDKLIQIMKQMDVNLTNSTISQSNSTYSDVTRNDIIKYNTKKLTNINDFLYSIDDIIKQNQNTVGSILKKCLKELNTPKQNIFNKIKEYITKMKNTENCKGKQLTTTKLLLRQKKTNLKKWLVDFEKNITENNEKINNKIIEIDEEINKIINIQDKNYHKMVVASLSYNDNNNNTIVIDPIYMRFNELTQLFYEYFYAIKYIEIAENNNLNRIGNIIRIIRLIIKTTEIAINTINSSIFKTQKCYEIYNTFNRYKGFLIVEQTKLVEQLKGININTPPNDNPKNDYLKGILKISVNSQIKTPDTTNDDIEEPITYEDKSSTVIPRTPTFVPHYGVLTKQKLTDITFDNIKVFKERTKDIFYDVEYKNTMQNRVNNKKLTLDEYCCYFYVDNTREINYKNITIYKNNIFVISRLYHDSSLTKDQTFGFLYDYTIATDTSKVSKPKFRYTESSNTIVDITLSALGIPSDRALYSMVYNTQRETHPMSVKLLNKLANTTLSETDNLGVTGFKRIANQSDKDYLYSYDLVLLNKNDKYSLKLL